MPMLLGTKGAEILEWRESRELAESLKERLTRKWGRSSARQAEEFLAQLIASLDEELEYESQLEAELSLVLHAVQTAAAPSDLPPLLARHRELVSAHFSRRGSVLALCSASSRMHDAVVSAAARLAEERMRRSGGRSAPVYALLASGDRGREEETLYPAHRYVLLHELDSELIPPFLEELSAVLVEAGLPPREGAFWHGSLSQWRRLLAEGEPRRSEGGWGLAPLPPFASATRQSPPTVQPWQWRLETMADLAFVTGFDPLGMQGLSAAASALKEHRTGDTFFQLARQVIHQPLALGHFGRWRLERAGEHRREIDLETLALSPLVAAVRVLAVHAGVHEGGTVRRIGALLYRGALDVELAGRLLKAFQCLMQMRIESEVRTEEGGAFANSEEFSLETDARLRGSVEAVLSLQKIAYQRMVGEV